MSLWDSLSKRYNAFEVMRNTLESTKKVTHPRETDIYDIFCAILYRECEGCSWRSLPHDFPKYVVIPKRLIVERSFGWLEDYRLLWKNCERKIHNTSC